MGPSEWTLVPGSLDKAYHRELHELLTSDALARLWAKDLSLWPSGASSRKIAPPNLAWLDLPEHSAEMARLSEIATAAEKDGFQDVVFVAMGDSNLAAHTISALPIEKRWKRFFVLDSTHPDAIDAVAKALDLQHTLFVFANKSGKHIETHSLLLYFLQRVKAERIPNPGYRFIAVTEDGSYLAELARQYQFRATFFDPPGIKGRYSALIHFGLLLSAIARVDPAALSRTAVSMRDLCRTSDAPGGNPALTLAAFLTAAAAEGDDRFVLLSPKHLAPFTYCVAQLVGVSTSKGGHGIVPVSAGFPKLWNICRRRCTAAIFTMRGEEAPDLEETQQQLSQAGTPMVRIELDGPEGLGPELFKWEIATALACSRLQVNPFDEPDCQDSKEKTVELLEAFATKQDPQQRTVRVREGDIELYAEDITRQEISTLSLQEAFRTFLRLQPRDGYLAILTFLDPRPAVRSGLEELREQLAASLGVPVLLSFGPRYLHCFGQVYHGGPLRGLFLLLTGEPIQDIEIPGAGYSFGQLHLALALGDFESLVSRKKPVVRLHLRGNVEHSLAQLGQFLGKR